MIIFIAVIHDDQLHAIIGDHLAYQNIFVMIDDIDAFAVAGEGAGKTFRRLLVGNLLFDVDTLSVKEPPLLFLNDPNAASVDSMEKPPLFMVVGIEDLWSNLSS